MYGVKLLYVFSEVIVFRVIVIMCKVYGGVYDVMNLKYIGVDMNFVWLIVEIVVMGVKGVSEIIFRKEIKEVVDFEKKLVEKEKEYVEKFVNLY